MQIKKIYILLIIFVNTNCSVSNEKEISNKQSLINFQKELIGKEITEATKLSFIKMIPYFTGTRKTQTKNTIKK